MYVNKCKHFMSPKGKFNSILKLTTTCISQLDQIKLLQSYVKNKKITCEGTETLKIIL